MQTVFKQHVPSVCKWWLNLPVHAIDSMLFFRGLKPGQEVLDSIGGAHRLQSWPHNILTGSFLFSERVYRPLIDANTDSGG